MKKWDRSLGTSKREQGIVTPKAPQNESKKQPWKYIPTESKSNDGWLKRLFRRKKNHVNRNQSNETRVKKD